MIKKVIMGTRLPAKLWLDEVEEGCLSQIVNLASMPYAFKHIAIMPDAHAGVGMPIGGVLATDGVVIPNAVGVDIGCGMCAVKTSLYAQDLERKDLTTVMGHVRKTVPLGFAHHKAECDPLLLPDTPIEDLPLLKGLRGKLLREVGTLGGGNHFIELQKETATGRVWAMIHTGSRHVGNLVAEHYNKRAEYWCQKWYAEMMPGLAFMPVECDLAKDYLREMSYCVELAKCNRKAVMERVMDGFRLIRPSVEFDPLIDIAHNYAVWEEHFGRNVLVHRKGATRAGAGEIGIIPGSMGTKSYIVEGLGNQESFMSCSHGAGRRMSRTAARENLSLAEECAKMDAKGIIHGMRKNGLDEAPGAYKDIDTVMANQTDLVRPTVELEPLAVVKGE